MGKENPLTKENIMKFLDACYGKCLDGIPHVSPSIVDMANDYLIKTTQKKRHVKQC